MDQNFLSLSEHSLELFREIFKKHEKSQNKYQSELQLIQEFDDSIPQSQDLQSFIDKIDEQIEIVNKSITKANQILLNIILKKPNDPVSDIIKNIIETNKNIVFQQCMQCFEHNKAYATIPEILNIEDNIQNQVDDLIEQDIYIETDKEKYERMTKILEHKKKVVPFLKSTD